MDLKSYIELSNINMAINPPCYLRDYHYFSFKLVENNTKKGGDEKSYNFVNNVEYLKHYLYFFNIEKHEKLIRQMIKKKKTDIEILNEVSQDIDPQYPDIDGFIREIVGDAKTYAYGKKHILHTFDYIQDMVDCDYIVITDRISSYDESEINYFKKYAKNVIILLIGYSDKDGLNFVKFVKFTLNLLRKPDPFYNSFRPLINTRSENQKIYYATGPKKNPLNIGIIKM